VHRAVINGDRQTGISIMRVVKELDAGPVFTMRSVPIGENDTTPEVERALSRLGADLVLDVVDQVALGTAIETPQDDSAATYAHKIEKQEGTVDWDQPAARLHNLIRGLQPWPLVSGRLNGVRFLVHRSTLADDTTTASGGTVVGGSTGVLAVAGSDGRVLHLLQVQPEGKRAMAARDFLAGHRVVPGACVERA